MWTSLGLNQGPPDYESVALTNWATSPACQHGCDKFCGAKVRIMSEMCKFFSLNLKKWILVVLSNVLFYSMFSRHGKAQASLALLIWLNENVPFHSTFSRHGKAQASLALLIWLNENLLFHGTFSRYGKAQASLALFIWLNENLLLVLPFSLWMCCFSLLLRSLLTPVNCL